MAERKSVKFSETPTIGAVISNNIFKSGWCIVEIEGNEAVLEAEGDDPCTLEEGGIYSLTYLNLVKETPPNIKILPQTDSFTITKILQ